MFAIIPPFIEVSGNSVMASDIIRFRSGSGEKVIRGWDMYQSPNDTAGIIWTRGCSRDGFGFQKLILLNPEMKHDYTVKSVKYTVMDGLPGKYVSHFVEDDHGNLWLATNGGISKFDPVREVFTNYGTDDGLPENSFISCAIRCSDGELLFCSWTGTFVSFYPDSLQSNDRIPPVVLTGLEINQQSVSPGDIPGADKDVRYLSELKLPHNQNNISLSYAALDFVKPDKNQYKYRLEGYNDKWVHAGHRTRVEYQNLRPRKYVFRVTGSNNDGVWNEEGTSLQITVKPPPWRTIWAYLIYALILAGIFRLYRNFLLKREQIRSAVQMERMEKEKVLEIERMKSRFFTNISHEFRTPLTLISGPVENLQRSTSGKVEISRDTLGMIHRNTKRLQSLINQLLDISKMETGKVKLMVSEGELESFLKTIILSFLSLAESKKIKYSFDLPESGMSLWFDADKLEKILVNLISNAFKFTPEKGEIRISCKYILKNRTEDPEYLSFTIADTGIGIPSDRIDKIFDRFYQVSSTDSRVAEGTGIGLALTRELVDLYRGKIMVESEPGSGSQFTVILPASKDLFHEDEIVTSTVKTPDISVEDDSVQYAEDLQEAEVGEQRLSDKTGSIILIVEDNADLRKYIASNLDPSFQIVEAENGTVGLEKAIDTIPDLVISDLMMPGMDGMEMCERLKSDERTSHIPVIMLTAKADRGSKLEGLRKGADDFIIKPFDAEELQVRVANLIEQRKSLRERYREEFLTDSVNIIMAPAEKEFLQKAVESIHQHLSEPEYNVEKLGDDMGLSRMHLYRKILALTDYSPVEFLRNIRLKFAEKLFREGHRNVAQVMYQVGFNTPSHFAQCFRQLYGMNPSEYIKNLSVPKSSKTPYYICGKMPDPIW